MCHLVLALPVLGLALFFVLPLPVALPLYLVVAAVSAVMYTAILRALRLPPATGLESMAGAPAHVAESLTPEGVIRYQGELWRAAADETIERGARVRIARVERRPEGMTVVVCRISAHDRVQGASPS